MPFHREKKNKTKIEQSNIEMLLTFVKSLWASMDFKLTISKVFKLNQFEPVFELQRKLDQPHFLSEVFHSEHHIWIIPSRVKTTKKK